MRLILRKAMHLVLWVLRSPELVFVDMFRKLISMIGARECAVLRAKNERFEMLLGVMIDCFERELHSGGKILGAELMGISKCF